MIGTWLGSCRCTGELMKKLFPFPETHFKINIGTFDGSSFSGTVHDDPATGGAPGAGPTKGERSKRFQRPV